VVSDLDVRPRETEVAACWVPAGTRVTLDGREAALFGLEGFRYLVLGWDKVSGGARVVMYGRWQGIRNGQGKASRPVWEQAAKILRQAERANAGPVVAYVLIEAQFPYPGAARPRLTAVRVRTAGE
jgi:hypothetical protein